MLAGSRLKGEETVVKTGWKFLFTCTSATEILRAKRKHHIRVAPAYVAIWGEFINRTQTLIWEAQQLKGLHVIWSGQARNSVLIWMTIKLCKLRINIIIGITQSVAVSVTSSTLISIRIWFYLRMCYQRARDNSLPKLEVHAVCIVLC